MVVEIKNIINTQVFVDFDKRLKMKDFAFALLPIILKEASQRVIKLTFSKHM